MPVNSVVRVVELPKRCRIRPRRPRCGRRRLNRAELAPHLMPGNQPSHGLRARHQLYLPRQLGAGAAVSPHKRASHAAQAAAAAPPPHPRGRRDGWSCHNSLVAAPSYLQRRQAAFTVLQQAILEVPLEGCCALQDMYLSLSKFETIHWVSNDATTANQHSRCPSPGPPMAGHKVCLGRPGPRAGRGPPAGPGQPEPLAASGRLQT